MWGVTPLAVSYFQPPGLSSTRKRDHHPPSTYPILTESHWESASTYNECPCCIIPVLWKWRCVCKTAGLIYQPMIHTVSALSTFRCDLIAWSHWRFLGDKTSISRLWRHVLVGPLIFPSQLIRSISSSKVLWMYVLLYLLSWVRKLIDLWRWSLRQLCCILYTLPLDRIC